MNPVVEHLDALERIARGFGPARLARTEWWLQTAKIGAAAEDWPTTWDRLQRLGDVLLEGAPQKAWDHFVAALLFTAIIGNLPSRVRSIFAYRSVTMRPAAPHLAVLKYICDPARPSSQTGVEVTRALTDLFPSWAPPHQALAWLLERHEDWINASQAHLAAARCVPNNTSFEVLAGVAMARAGRYTEARPLLRALPAHEVPGHLLTWWALAMVYSPFYLDRYRAYDTLQDCVIAARQARLDARVELDVAVKAAEAVLASAPIVVDDEEAERLFTLLDATHSKADSTLRAHIATRLARSKVSDWALKTANLNDLSMPSRAFVQVLNDVPRTPDEDEHPCVGCIAALKHKTPPLDLLERVEKALKNSPSHTWTAWVVFWLELPEDLDETSLRKLASLIQTWVWKSPEPSCGWWGLARHFAGRGWIEPAYACADQARLIGARPNAEALQVIPHLLEYAVQKHDDRGLRDWLEFTLSCQPRVGGNEGT